MSTFAGFREQSFMDQIALLSVAERSSQQEDIAHLQELFLEPVGDAAVDTMVRNALRSLLLRHTGHLLRGLEEGQKPLARYCAALAGDSGLAAAVPALLRRGAQWEEDAEALHEILLALGRIGDPAGLELFRKHLKHPDDFISSLCIEQLGALGDVAAQLELEAIVTANEQPERYEQCDVATWKAIEALAAIGTPDALSYLASKLHHENPTARRIVHRALVEAGEAAVPFVEEVLRSSQLADDRIMAANVLGFSGARKAADALVRALDDGLLSEPNQRFAAYEALGRVPGIKGLVYLEDALWSEDDPLLLLAVVRSLDTHGQAGMARNIARKMAQQAEQQDNAVQRLLEAVVAAGAVNLFTALQAQPEVAGKLLDTAYASAAPEQLESFALALEAQPDPQAAAAAERLRSRQAAAKNAEAVKLLAVDDSDAMRKFYVQVGSELGYRVTTAEHGQDALDRIERGETFDILVVDMNMPVMDGIEFTGKLRAMPEWEGVPVIMASTESARSQAQLAKKAGVSTFVVKPFSKEVFKNKIAKMLG